MGAALGSRAMLLQKWVFYLIATLVPHAAWSDSFFDTSEAIAQVATEEPVFAGEHGPEKTAALLVSLASFESAFDPDALGDCHGKEPSRENCDSWGLYQINKYNFKMVPGVPVDDAVFATREAVRMIRVSQRVCARRPVQDMLGWYAAGGNGCEQALNKSHYRVWRAQKLQREHPFLP